MYIMVWFIMFRYLLVIADKRISDIMYILTILIDTINNFFKILRKLKAVKRKNKKSKSMENSCTLLYKMHHCFMMSWLTSIKKNIINSLKAKAKTGGKTWLQKSERLRISIISIRQSGQSQKPDQSQQPDKAIR